MFMREKPNIMLSPEQKKRLEDLNKGSLKHADIPVSDEGGSGISVVTEPALLIKNGNIDPIKIEEAVPGQITKEADSEFLLIKNYCAETEELKNLGSRFEKLFVDQGRNPANIVSAGMAQLRGVSPEKVLFLDIETCGLRNIPLFLIGVAYFNTKEFSFLQMFARDYDEERPLLSFFNRFLAYYDLLVTYNGKTFDIPFILSRGVENRVFINSEKKHLDLLIEVRKYWKGTLPDCRLQTVEKNILGVNRSGDIPGADIPRVYHEYLHSRDATDILRVLDHNIRDIISMIDILVRMPDDYK